MPTLTTGERLHAMLMRLEDIVHRYDASERDVNRRAALNEEVETIAAEMRATVRGPARSVNPPIGRVGNALVW